MKARLNYEGGVTRIEINGECIEPVSFRAFWPQPGTTHDLYGGRRYGPGVTADLPVRQGETLLLQHR